MGAMTAAVSLSLLRKFPETRTAGHAAHRAQNRQRIEYVFARGILYTVFNIILFSMLATENAFFYICESIKWSFSMEHII